jgi:hypothetical protein
MSNASPFWTSTLQDLSIDIKSATSHGVLTPQNALWSFGSPFGTPTLTNSQHGSSLGSVRVHSLTLFALPGACDMTPGSAYKPTTLQPPWSWAKARVAIDIIWFYTLITQAHASLCTLDMVTNVIRDCGQSSFLVMCWNRKTLCKPSLQPRTRNPILMLKKKLCTWFIYDKMDSSQWVCGRIPNCKLKEANLLAWL